MKEGNKEDENCGWGGEKENENQVMVMSNRIEIKY